MLKFGLQSGREAEKGETGREVESQVSVQGSLRVTGKDNVG